MLIFIKKNLFQKKNKLNTIIEIFDLIRSKIEFIQTVLSKLNEIKIGFPTSPKFYLARNNRSSSNSKNLRQTSCLKSLGEYRAIRKKQIDCLLKNEIFFFFFLKT